MTFLSKHTGAGKYNREDNLWVVWCKECGETEEFEWLGSDKLDTHFEQLQHWMQLHRGKVATEEYKEQYEQSIQKQFKPKKPKRQRFYTRLNIFPKNQNDL